MTVEPSSRTRGTYHDRPFDPSSGVADLPFKEEARLINGFVRALFTDLPKAFRGAMRAQHIYQELYVLDSAGLAALGVERMNIGRYAVEHSGLLEK